MQKQIDQSYQSLQKQIDDIKTFMLWGFGILFSGMGIVIGLIFWDRRSTLSPVQSRLAAIEDVLRKVAKKDHTVADALKHAGLL